MSRVLFLGGDDEIRTRDPLLARQVLSQLSYAPILVCWLSYPTFFLLLDLVGSSGLEPPTSRLSGVRSNQLSYEPMIKLIFLIKIRQPPTLPGSLPPSTIGRL